MQNTKERPVFFERQDRKELGNHFAKSRQLFGAEIRFDTKGNIFFTTTRDVPVEKLTSYVVKTNLPEQTNIYAPNTRYNLLKEVRVHQITGGNGGVETAIRAMDHILEGERGKESQQAEAVKERAGNLLDIFSINFSELTEGELAREQQETYALLVKVGFNPATVIAREKKKMAGWITKASFGEDGLGRRNKLITAMALTAAHRQAIQRQGTIGTIVSKFAQNREALIFEREFARAILSEVSFRILPEKVPGHTLFKYPDKLPTNVGIVLGIINTLKFQLEQPHVRPYRTIGLSAIEILTEIADLLKQNKRREIVEKGLFANAYKLIANGLNDNRDIYPRKVEKAQPKEHQLPFPVSN